MSNVQFMPQRQPLVDPNTGIITNQWYVLFQTIFGVGGGLNDETNGPIAVSFGQVAQGGLTPATTPYVATDDQTPAVVPYQPPITDLASDLLPATQFVSVVPDDVSPPQQPLFVALDDVIPIIGGLRDEIAILRSLINDLRQGGQVL